MPREHAQMILHLLLVLFQYEVAADFPLPEHLMTNFPEGLLGTWLPSAMPQSILGPLAYEFLSVHAGAFSAQRDERTGDIFFTLLEGQVFRVRGDQMQYCFGPAMNEVVAEQSPFSVDSANETAITLCWRQGLKGMQTHAKNCRGCDCAKITITLHDKDNAEFYFWQSPPVIHAHVLLRRSGPAPSMNVINNTMPDVYKNCQITNECGAWQVSNMPTSQYLL